MRTAILILCAVAADAAPLAAKSVSSSVAEVSSLTSDLTPAPAATVVPKTTKSKKFRPADDNLLLTKNPRFSIAKLEGNADVRTTESPAGEVAITPTPAPLAVEAMTTVAGQSAAPLVEENGSTPVSGELELLKSHISATLVSTPLFEDEKAGRFRHSALFGFSSFF